MSWTREKTTWLGTYREKRGKWHGIPYVLSSQGTKGMTHRGWTVIVLASLLLIGILVLEELLI